jgi:general secretion pathway protein H
VGPLTRGASKGRERGFTLLELLVALVVVAVLIGMVAVSGTPAVDRALRFEAERLAQLLSLAREEAQVRGAPIRFDADADGYQFAIFRERQWRPILDDRDLRPRRWEAQTRVVVVRADGAARLVFGRDLVEAPYELRLQRDGATAVIYANGLGSFEIAN